MIKRSDPLDAEKIQAYQSFVCATDRMIANNPEFTSEQVLKLCQK
jgi:hypothetical protein